MKRTFLVIFEKGKKNYGGFAPDVAGCGSLGNTLEEIRMNLKEALELYMDYSVEAGLPLPEAKTKHVTLPIEGETDPKITYVVEWMAVKIPQPRKSRTKFSRTKAGVRTRQVLQAA
jgi:predicted RNase H-like HicB family nuclease